MCRWCLPVAVCLLFVGPASAEGREPHPKLLKAIAKQFSCEADQVSASFLDVEQINGRDVESWTIEGCGEPFMASTYGKSSIYRNDRALRKKAPLELSCEASEVTYRFIDVDNRIAEGCGTQITYLYANRKWIANVGRTD